MFSVCVYLYELKIIIINYIITPAAGLISI